MTSFEKITASPEALAACDGLVYSRYSLSCKKDMWFHVFTVWGFKTKEAAMRHLIDWLNMPAEGSE